MTQRRYRRSRTDYPKGVLAVYDNRGETIDRYTVLYEPEELDGERYFPYLTMSGAPFDPQGFCQHSEVSFRINCWGTPDRVITFEALPADCQAVVRRDLNGSERP